MMERKEGGDSCLSAAPSSSNVQQPSRSSRPGWRLRCLAFVLVPSKIHTARLLMEQYASKDPGKAQAMEAELTKKKADVLENSDKALAQARSKIISLAVRPLPLSLPSHPHDVASGPSDTGPPAHR